MVLGEKGFWLPWSIDIACYAMVFYQLGVYFRKYDLLSKVKNSHILYFILTPIWVYMIYAGSMVGEEGVLCFEINNLICLAISPVS